MITDASDTHGSASETTHARIERTAERIKEGASSVAQSAKDAVDRAEAGAERASDAGARGAHRAADRGAGWRDCGNAALDSARERTGEFVDAARDFVRDKPVESVAIALAAGWLVGRLLRSRR